MKIPVKSTLLSFSVSILTFLFLSIDWFMQVTGKGSLCPTSSCQVAAESTRFGEHVMVGLGAIYFLALSLLLFWQKYNGTTLSSSALSICLFSGMAFDGGILGFQYFNLAGKCPLCWAVALSLFGVAVIHSIQKRTVVFLLTGCLVWFSAFMANAAVVGHQPTPSLEETALWKSQSSTSLYPRYHFFWRLNCPHCTVVIKALKDHSLSGQWAISFVDRDEESLKRLSAIYSRIQNGPSFFTDLLSAKDDLSITRKTILPKITSTTKKARHYFSNNEFKGVPVLIIQFDENRKQILIGDDAILHYLDSADDQS